MKDGYIVWNDSTAGCEFFGVFKSYKPAFRLFRKVVKNRYGKCPRNYDDILTYLSKIEVDDGLDDSIRITRFNQNEG